MFDYEEEIENRKMYDAEMEKQSIYEWARYYQEESDRAKAHWDDFEDRIRDRLNV